ncbi:MAG: transposase, partial [Gemmatimonadales bacterium]|nr:transposase [Gemmatimonadales bacterium]
RHLAHHGQGHRREQFLREMDAVVPWDRLLALIAPHYHPRGGRGRAAQPLPIMLRSYFPQQRYAFSDPQAEEAPYDSETMRRFAMLELGEDAIPDESTILRFRHLLERHQLTAQIFDAVRDLLEENRSLLRRARSWMRPSSPCRARRRMPRGGGIRRLG